MNLKRVQRTKGRKYTGVATLSVTAKGTMYVSPMAMELLGIEKASFFNLFKDDAPDAIIKWYLSLGDLTADITIKRKSDGDKSGTASSGNLSNEIRDSYYHESPKVLKFKVLEAIDMDGVSYFPLELIKESLVINLPGKNSQSEKTFGRS